MSKKQITGLSTLGIVMVGVIINTIVVTILKVMGLISYWHLLIECIIISSVGPFFIFYRENTKGDYTFRNWLGL